MGNVRIPSLEALSQHIINDVEPTEDGGFFRLLFKEILARNDSNLVSDFISDLRSKGTYDLALSLGIFWCIFISIIAVIFIIYSYAVSRTSCCRTNTKIQRVWTTILSKVYVRFFRNSKDPYAKENFNKASIRVGDQSSGRCMKVLLVLVVVVLLLFFSGLMVAYAANNPLQWTIDSREAPSLKSAVNSSLDDARDFVVNGIDQGSNLTSTVMSSFSSQLQVAVQKAVKEFTDRLLTNYGVNALFEKANLVIGDIQDVLTAMQYIYDSQLTVFPRLNQFKGFINTIRDQLSKISDLCVLDQSESERQQCLRLSELQKRLIVNIDQSKLNFESSTSLLFLLREMSLNISSLSAQINSARNGIDEMLSTVYVSIQKDFNLDSVLNSVDSIWVTANESAKSLILDTIDDLQYNDTISGYINTASVARKLSLGIIGFFLFVFLVSAVSLLVIIISINFGRHKKEKYVNETESVSNTDSTEESCNHSRFIPKRFETKVPVNVFNCYFIFMGFLVILPAGLVVGSFIIGAAMENEACRYLVTEDGLIRIDNYVDDYLTDNWNTFTDSLNISIAGIDVVVKQPSDIILAITDKCSNTSKGLLAYVGLNDILDVDKLVNSEMFTTMINAGKEFAKKTIGELDAKSMIPTSMTPLLKEAANLTKMLVDKIHYEESIQELEKDLLQIPNFTEFVNDLDDYVKKMKARYPSNSYIAFLEIIVPTLYAKNDEYVKLTASLQEVLKHFITLQETRTISQGLNELLVRFDNVVKILSNPARLVEPVDQIYDEVMITAKASISVLLKISIKTLENELLPCQNLQNAFTVTTDTICKVFVPEFNAFTVAYGWSVIWLQILIIILLALLAKIRKQQEPLHSEC